MAVPVATPCSTRATTRDGTPSAVQKTADQERGDQHRAAPEAVTLRPDRQQGAEQPPDVHGEDDGDPGDREIPAFRYSGWSVDGALAVASSPRW